jgi:hypothetical protein
MILKSLLASLVALVGLSGGARAAFVDVTYDGTISIGQDAAGLFGVGSSLDGATVAIVYKFDTTQGFTLSSATQNNAWGGWLFGNGSPAIGASITIGGQTETLGGGEYGIINGTNNASYSFQSHEADESDQRYVYSSITAVSGALPASITSAFTYEVQPGDNAFGYFHLSDQTFGAFIPTSISESVPEPSTWALMLLGVGGLGVATHRRRRTAALA